MATFAATPEELELIAEILTFTRSEMSRIVSTEAAIDVFERSDLKRNDLKEIWRLADKDRNGMLTSKELAVALRLIGWVQAGEPLAEHLIELPGPLPTLKGISDVEKRLGPPVVPTELAPAPQRMPSLPMESRSRQRSTDSASASSSRIRSPQTPPRPKETSPIISPPPTSLHNLSFLTTPRTKPTRRRTQTSDDAHTPQSQLPESLSRSISDSTPGPKLDPLPTPSSPPLSVVSDNEPEPPREPPAQVQSPAPVLSPSISISEVDLDLDPFEAPASPSPSPPALPTPPPTAPPVLAPAAEVRSSEADEVAKLKALLEAAEQKAEALQRRLAENETMMAQVLGANDDELKGLEAQYLEATVRIAQLEGCEKERDDALGRVEVLTLDVKAKEEAMEAQAKANAEMQDTLGAKEKEIMDLEKRASEMEDEREVEQKAATSAAQRLMAENAALTEREKALVEDNRKLSTRVQELEVIAAELQWSETDVGLQRALQNASEESDKLKREVGELNERIGLMQRERERGEVELSGLQRQLVEVRRENARLALGQTTSRGHASGLARVGHGIQLGDMDPPPPAYDDAVFV
ncbi:hypothetical protein D9611_011985 [Ephemerocybe angulata]|uniref:EF-hand domain-containing protein n=1 Tax=Ephemerocybe angulata TaxID=980116 RepID=A0A8H5C611_9AGAR|nr:hypothetical protein D9611_011985 [Tulosesus angulatus]